MRLNDKVAIVTGAASGIGKATAQVFAREGCKVVLADINEAGLKETLAEISAGSGEAFIAPGDLTRSEDVQRIVGQTIARYGRLNALSNCHGISLMEDTRIVDVPEEVFDRTIAANLRTIFLTCKYSIPHLKAAGGGAIVNVASGAALGGGGGTSYTASKGGVAAITRAISYQNAPDLIRCNVICPGPVDTPMLKVSMKKLKLDTMVAGRGTIPRVARPEEIAYLIAFLVSEEAQFITGATYAIDGGSTLH